jgi:LacI family repressor for deo operon, udp, cdd, tsx, nupC, and nupG
MRSKLKITAIAKIAGVSPSTVSRVINHREQVKEETILVVENAMRQLGYNPSETVVPQKKQNKILLMNCPQTDNPFYHSVIDGAQAAATANGYHLLINYGPLNQSNMESFLDLAKTVDACGVILLSNLPLPSLNLLSSKLPAVQCCEYNSDSDIPYVSIDNKAAAYNAVRFLIHAGRRRVAFVGGPKNYRYSVERYEGYQFAMEESQLSTPNYMVSSVPKIDYSMAMTIVRQMLLRDHKPNAIFAVSDTIAAAAINISRIMNLRVPEDIMIKGFDDTPICQIISPSITSVRQPKFQMGFTACEMLVELVQEHYVNQPSVILPTELIVRESALISSFSGNVHGV